MHLWENSIYMQHIAIERLAMAGGIQGNVVDTTIALLKFHGVEPTIKWVNDFIFFRSPMVSALAASSPPSFSFDLKTINQITDPLGIPWHPLSKKGHNFHSSFSYLPLSCQFPIHVSTRKP